MCTINTPKALINGDNTCCDAGTATDLVLASGAVLFCPTGTCSVTFLLTNTFSMTSGGSPAPAINTTGAVVVTAATASFIGAFVTAPIIVVTTTTGLLSCKTTTLNTSASAPSCANGTPKVPGYFYVPGFNVPALAVGLGAAKAGAGGTGYDGSTSSLSAAGATYDTNSIFNLDAAVPSDLRGCQGGKGDYTQYDCIGCAAPVEGLGGGAVKLLSAESLSLDGCAMYADGSYGSRGGAGSGGAIVLNAANDISVGDTGSVSVASARGGDAVSQSVDYPCKTYPCGMPGGGGFVFARSGVAGDKALAAWGTNAAGGRWSKDSNTICGGGGLLVDCQPSTGAGCVVTVSGDAACAASAAPYSSQCNNGLYTGPCLLPPTPLNCTPATCAALALNKGVNVSLAGPLSVGGALTAESAAFSSAQAATEISSDGPMTLTDVTFVTHSGGAARNLTVSTASPTSDLVWTVTKNVAIVSIVGSLTVASGGNLVLDFNDVSVSAPPSKADDASCSSATWEGALLAYAAADELSFGGSGINLGSLLLYANKDIALKTCSVVARGCAGAAGLGKGATQALSGAYAAFSVGGGASHFGSGGGGYAGGIAPDPAAGVPYDQNPLNDAKLNGGSGGGGGAGAPGGAGGGTVLLVCNGTLKHTGSASKFDISGSAGASNATSGAGGGGSGGMMVVALNSFSGATDGAALNMVEINANGGSGGFASAPAPLCGGSGSGGTVIIAAPGVGPSGQPLPSNQAPKVSNAPGAVTASCAPLASPGASGTVVFTALPTPPSPSQTPSGSTTLSFSPTQSSSPTVTPSVTPSGTPSPSGSDTVSPSATFTGTPTPSFTSSTSGTLTVTPSATASCTASPTYLPSKPDTLFGIPTAAFYASVGGGVGLLLLAVGCGVARACRKPDPLSLNDSQGGGGPSVWSDAYAEKASLLRSPTEGGAQNAGYLRGSFYVPPSGVV